MNCSNNDNLFGSDAETLYAVGRRFLNGDCVEQDIERARDLLSQASRMGFAPATRLLSTIPAPAQNDCVESDAYKKMLAGEVYLATDPYLLTLLNNVKDLCWEYNNIRPTKFKERNDKLKQILGQCDDETFINQPFYCDYGKHIRVGKRFFANFGWTVLDEAYVTIGDDCFIGPNVGIYTACHSTDPQERNTREEWARPVTIGNNCWIGGSVVILPGVTIGDNVTIGAGSVVVHDIPSNSLAVGNPAKVKKQL